MVAREGGCLCGAVRFSISGEPRATTICHCTRCQRSNGSAFTVNVVVRETDYEQVGDTRRYIDKGDSGNPLYRHFCVCCGSPIFSVSALAPGMIVVKGGTLDHTDGLQPRTEIYTDYAVDWLMPAIGTSRFPQNED